MQDKLRLLAGIFWGEGCARITKAGELRAHVTNTDTEMLEEFVQVVGGKIFPMSDGREARGWKPIWRWEVTGMKACDFLDQIVTFLGGEKRKAVDLCCQWRLTTRGTGHRTTSEMKTHRALLYQQLKHINNPNGNRGTRRIPIASAESLAENSKGSPSSR